MVAQSTSSVTDDQIRAIIYALLGVALFLGILTAWYFVHTSPRRRMRAAAARPATARAAPVDDRPEQPPDATVPTSVDEDEEWLRLTAPAPRPRVATDPHPAPGRNPHG